MKMAAPMPVRAVVFDWGGTLTPYHDLDLDDMWRVVADVVAPQRSAALTRALRSVEDEFWLQVEESGGDASTTLEDVLDLAATRTGIEVHMALRSAAFAAYLEAWTPHTQSVPWAASVLSLIRERGIAIGLLSNTVWPRAWHERFLERDGILGLIDARVYTSELRHSKPHREAFSAVLDRLGIEGRHAVMVGDRPLDDIEGGRALGMRTVLLPNCHARAAPVKPDAVISSLDELPTLLAGWA
jgi:putative hydrolase of the HAD superfamily